MGPVDERVVVRRCSDPDLHADFPFFLFKILIMQSCISLAWPVWLSGGVVLEGHGNIDVWRVNGRCEGGGV